MSLRRETAPGQETKSQARTAKGMCLCCCWAVLARGKPGGRKHDPGATTIPESCEKKKGPDFEGGVHSGKTEHDSLTLGKAVLLRLTGVNAPAVAAHLLPHRRAAHL